MARAVVPPQPALPPEAPVRPGMKACPIAATNALFGKKWTFAILRDVVYFRRTRFAEFLGANPGLTDRVLARRLNELVAEGILERTGRGKAVRYRLTERGKDTRPILAAIYNYGIRNRPEVVFKDARPRPLRQVLPEWDAAFLERIFRVDVDPLQAPAPAEVPMPSDARP
jgi:DNA-binding HxlR family transcriptional regulator